ncbi:uncharacterized protein LOC106715925 [Papilio machaon]|uniref:uncharacterized protein LOC106715925 n=1 Tax=Papilio machaon TaxID=76193 RepID=UPI001E665508|nr:uncharacterized protein LOC106715925 [Papilio machaon]
MSWFLVLTLVSILSLGSCINRPVYKIVLTQKGFSQFIQYDIDTPPIREFTFCTWVRLYDLNNEQGLFSYVVNSNRVVRLWLENGGHFMKVSINERTPSMISVSIVRDSWKHICLSYQADYGAWALYMDGRLISCEALQSLRGFVLPGGGSVIIGYGTSNAIPSGIEGEVFGVNMILSSTIERNHTIKRDPLYAQKRFLQNRVFGNRNLKYIVLGKLDSKEIKNNYETSKSPPTPNKNPINIRYEFPYNFSENNHLEVTSLPSTFVDNTVKDIFDFSLVDTTGSTDKINFWNMVNEPTQESKYNLNPPQSDIEVTDNNETENKTATVSIWNTLSPPRKKNIFSKTLKATKPIHNIFYELNDDGNNINVTNVHNESKETSTAQTSFPSENSFNQKIGSKISGNVLNYLKRINYYMKETIKVPVNVPLVKISDDFEKPKELNGVKVHQPLKFQRRNFVSKQFDKREIKINGSIVNANANLEDRNSNITFLNPTLKEGENLTSKSNQRIYRNIDGKQSSKHYDKDEIYRFNPYVTKENINNKNVFNSDISKKNNQHTILPFIKSIEYFINDRDNSSNELYNDDINSSDLFTRSVMHGNKWRNVHTYSNDYTPRRVNLESGLIQRNDISEANRKLPSLRLKYKPEIQKFLTDNKDPSIIEGRALAKAVSNESNHGSFSILKYNRGFLPKRRRDQKPLGRVNRVSKTNNKEKFAFINNNSNDIKSDTYLEPLTLSEELNINKRRPELNRIGETSSPYYGLKICMSLQAHNHNLYVQPDGSIDLTRIVSPVKDKNTGVEFMMQNYKRCSLKDSILEGHPLLFIDWDKTPVRLFGGAYPKKTTDLCGFF